MKALLVAAVAALALAAPALASERHPTLNELENQLMCPICAGETLAQSDSLPAQRIKAHIQQRIRQGWTRSEIIREEQDIWGTRILAAPPRHGFDLLAWVLPLVGIIGAAVVIGVLAWRWSRRREEPEHLLTGPASLNGRPLDPELERRLDEELARFDG
jgi:cytochrome c-type biogenesis protein CcmH